MMNESVAKAIVDALEKCGVEHIFGMPGYQNLELYDCFLDSHIKNILVTNESFATFMASGYSWASGKIGVCISIPGPGLTNMFTGLAQALVDSVPILVLVTGIKMGKKSFCVHQIKQLEAVRPIVKDVFKIKTPNQIPDVIFKACKLTQTGEPGPVVIEIPEDLLSKEIITEERITEEKDAQGEVNKKKIREIVDILKKSKFCGIYVGKGAFGASKELIELAEAISAPIATTISGKGIIPEDHPQAVGFGFGPSGTNIAEEIFKKCDTLLAVGCKFSEVATGQWGFKIPENLIHIDRNAEVLDKNYKARISLCVDAKVAFNEILIHIDEIERERNLELINEINEGKREYLERIKKSQIKDSVHPAKFFYELRRHMERDAILTVDCGYHQLWALTDFAVFEPRTFITSCDYQAMGFAIPAAIGAKLANPDKEVICVCGDGGFLMSSFELLTARREGLKIIVIIFNDGELGLIKHIQQKIYGRTNAINLINPDFEAFAKSIGVNYVKIGNDDQTEGYLKDIFLRDNSVIVDVKIRYDEEPRYYKGLTKTLWNRLSGEEKLKLSRKIMEQRSNGTSRN